MRLAAWASSRELKKKKPDLYFNLQKFLFEAGYPKKLIEGDVSFPVHVKFELVRTPMELEKPSILVEPKLIEYESSGIEEADTTEPVTVN